MKFFEKHFSGFAMALLFALSLPVLRADQWDKRTVIRTDQAIQVPNVVLQPGTYVFRLLDNPGNRNIVEIFNSTEQHLITTVLVLPNYRLTATDKTVVTFWETPPGVPPAVRAWFYPGDNYGQEFVYPKSFSAQIAAANNTSVPTTASRNAEEMKTAPVTSTNQAGEQKELNTQAYAAPQTPAPAPPPQQAAPAPAPHPPAQTPTESELPHTASATPLAGLIGVISIAGYFALRRRAGSR